ncbi:microcompartment protein EutL [Suicoccus acidiformans]|uniref:Microcompartment protein EutL n=1 Tax=Suicoccus acidiformans TaxID=2036206 RepID=A0A347WLZ0_9LACT|nr:ethanolamine utilization microcompartment protein EutL [Suicoccus acidiformans]AXY26097.1 microcompartment protein EutL [Suicoccus acidiformans]
MINDRIKANVLSVRMIPNVDAGLAEKLNLQDHQSSIGILTCDSDDVTYVALDEATKKAAVDVVYGSSFYAGADNANTALAGEVIGILAGPSPAEVRAGLDAAVHFIEEEAHFVSANDDDSVIYFAHNVSRSGSYLSEMAEVSEGQAIAYLIAPPLEAVFGVDAALKAADVEIKVFYEPPTETNFGGALLTGSQSACQAACDAFAEAVKAVASNPLVY